MRDLATFAILVGVAGLIWSLKMSTISKFVFDPIKAAIARALSSSNPTAQATAQAAKAVVDKVTIDTSTDALTHNSAAGVASNVIGDLETGLKGVVDSFVYAAVFNAVPVAGAILAPEAVKMADWSMAFAEQHALTYVASLFAHHNAVISGAAATAPAGAANSGGSSGA